MTNFAMSARRTPERAGALPVAQGEHEILRAAWQRPVLRRHVVKEAEASEGGFGSDLEAFS